MVAKEIETGVDEEEKKIVLKEREKKGDMLLDRLINNRSTWIGEKESGNIFCVRKLRFLIAGQSKSGLIMSNEQKKTELILHTFFRHCFKNGLGSKEENHVR
jgi:hypothetical protein